MSAPPFFRTRKILRSPSGDRTNRSLLATAGTISVVALIACWFGTRAAVDDVLVYESRQVAVQWAVAFSHTLEPEEAERAAEVLRPYGSAIHPQRLRALDNAMFAGEIVGYTIFNRDGVIVAASRFETVGNTSDIEGFDSVIDQGATITELGHHDHSDGAETHSLALAPLVWRGQTVGAIQTDVDVTVRAAQLERLRLLAFFGLAALLAVVIGVMGFSVSRALRRRRRAEAELILSEAQYRHLMDNSRAAIIIHNGEEVVYANTAAAELHGAGGVSALLGMDPVDLVPDEARPAMRERIAKFTETGQVLPVKLNGRRRLNGELVETDTFTSGVDWYGEDCILVQSWDVGVERRAQIAVAESEARLSALLENAPFAISIKGTDRRQLVVNRAYADLVGMEPEEIVGLTVHDYFPLEIAEQLTEGDHEVLDTGGAFAMDLGLALPDGTERIHTIRKFPVRTREGETIGIAGMYIDVTEERQRERAIAESEARFRAFLDHSSAVIYMKDKEHLMTMVNRSFEEFNGLSADEVIGRKFGTWLNEDAARVSDAQDREVVRTGKPVSREVERIAGDGSHRIVLSEKFPIFGPDGTLLEIGGINTDITALRQKDEENRIARIAAERAERQLKAFLDNSRSAMYLKDRDLRITMVNRAFEQQVGMTDDEYLGKAAHELLPKALADEMEVVEHEVLRSGKPMSLEGEVASPDGGTRIFMFEKFPILAANGDVVGIGGVNVDITEAREHDRAIVESESRLTAFLNHAPMMTIITDRERRIIKTNRGYEEFFGIDGAEVFGRTDRAWLPTELNDVFEDEADAILNEARTVDRTIEVPNRHGDKRLLRQVKFPIDDGEGNAVAVGTIMIDITEEKEHERELERARDEAEAANRAKSAFLANMSHEIRTPMNGVIGMTDLLSQTSLTPDQYRHLNTIRRSGDALLGVINNVLDVSRIEAGEFRLDVASFDLHELAADAVEMLAENASTKGVSIALHVSNNVPFDVQGDDVRLRQVLINLLGNAIKFTDEGEVILRVSRVGGESDAPLIRFEVTDTGIGIPRDKQINLFEAFNQADDSITRRFGGTGLGLSIAQHIVRLMGGRIDVDSRPDEGSSFVFTIPLVALPSAEAHDDYAAGLAGKRMLIIDDNPTNLEILAEFAKGWQMPFACAESAEEALAAMRYATENGRPFDIALIDIVMPDIDGIQLAATIRADRDFDSTRLVALTSFNWDRDNAISRDAGFSQFATKPVRRSELGRILQSVLAADGSPTADGTKAADPAQTLTGAVARNATVLLAEDSAVNQEIGREYLVRQGCTVITADNGREAVEMFRKGGIDLVLMDVQMPEMDGIEATRLIREYETRTGSPKVPVIAATAHAFQEDREKCILAGMDDFLSKPFTRKELTPVLDRWLGTAPAAAPVEEVPVDVDVPAVLDPETVRQLRSMDGGGTRILKKVAIIFTDQVPTQISNLRTCLDDGDFSGVANIAHGLKSSAANVAAMELSKLFKELEFSARSDDLEHCRTLLPEVDAMYSQVRRALKDVIDDNAFRESA